MAKANGAWRYDNELDIQEHILREWTVGSKSWAQIRGQLVGLAQPELIDLAFPTAVIRARQEAEQEGRAFEEPDLANWEDFEPTVIERTLLEGPRMSDLVDEATATEHSIPRHTGDAALAEPAALPD